MFHNMLIDKIMWPVEDGDEDEQFDVESKCCITGFLQMFTEGFILYRYRLNYLAQ